jgi:hypothetical protein
VSALLALSLALFALAALLFWQASRMPHDN